ncbi:MAG: GAF domain-containing protein [Candidatus Cybelea sp.]
MSDVSYEQLEERLRALLDGEINLIANAANFAAFIAHELPLVNWAGFYFTTPSQELVLGPFCGRPACTRIPPGRGVCGAAAAKLATLVVDDVNAFDDHIACDAASRSEIVVPLFIGGEFAGVFDCDSPLHARFTDPDRLGIESLVRAFIESVRPQAASAR